MGGGASGTSTVAALIVMAGLLSQLHRGLRQAAPPPVAHAWALRPAGPAGPAAGPAGPAAPAEPPSPPMSLEERVVAAEVASRRAGGVRGVIEVQSRRRSDAAGQGLVRGVRPDADLGAGLGADLPEFPPPPPREPLRVSEFASHKAR